MISRLILFLCFLLVAVKTQDHNNQNAPSPQNQQQQQAPPPQQQNQAQNNRKAEAPNYDNSQRLAQNDACRTDIENFCGKIIAQLKPGEVLSDMAALECLQDAAYSEESQLQGPCGQAVWEYKLALTQDPRFVAAITQFCPDELKSNPKIKECTLDMRPGYALSCMMDHAHEIQQNTRCFQFLVRTEKLAFSDFRLIAPFAESCGQVIADLHCGTLTKPSAHQNVRMPHTQGATLQCLVEKMVNIPQDPTQTKIIEGMPNECRRQVMRIAELQFEDFHLDRPLFFACRKDRDHFCGDVPAGEGKVFQCLMEHKDSKDMEPECSKMLSERAGMMGRDYRLAHPLTKACGAEMNAYRCIPQAGFEKSLHFHLSWVLLCLESGLHHYKQQMVERQQLEKEGKPVDQKQPASMPFTEPCQHEMLGHRQMMVAEFRMSPEVVMSCAQEISSFCSSKHDLENEGKTLHCLMAHAQERTDEKKKLSTQCRNSLEAVIKVADIGSNYKVDKMLYAACKPLIEGKCQKDVESEASTLECLMKNIDGTEMTDDCKQRLIEVQYFMARDWSLDPDLYNACHKEAIDRCSAVDNWHMLEHSDSRVDPGPQVLSCLYRAGYDEEHPLSTPCAQNVRRVLRDRAARVNLLPEIEEACRDALSEYCSTNVRPTEEMECLQQEFEKKQFKDHYPQCYKEIFSFTKMESKDTKLNRLLNRACRPVIETHCEEFAEKEIDHGDIMECLSVNKKSPEMTPKCHSYVQHFELVSLRDYHFSYRFTEACQNDIQQYCAAFGQDKGAIIRCLSDIMFEHRVLGESKDLHKECKKQLRAEYLKQEQVNFDDQAHMGDADPELMQKCDADVKRLRCMENKGNFEDVVECLRLDFDNLDPSCKAIVFGREKIEALDNTFDDELQKSCKYDIGKFCKEQQGERVLDCLMNTKIIRLFQKDCRKVVEERMLERVKDDRLNPGLLEACKSDAEHYCPDDYRKINDARYAKQQLGGIIASCLRGKFAQFNNGIRLSPQCKGEVSKVILESEFDIQLDPALYKSCRLVINRHCSSAILQRGGNFDNVLECLKADFYTGQIQDSDCARQLARRTQESLVDIHLDPGLHEACSLDIQRVCKETPPGQSRIIMCLMDALQVQQARMSAQCRTKLMERQKLWNMAHDKYKMLLPQSWTELYTVIASHPERTSILTWAGIVLIALLIVGCFCGRWTKNTYSELKNR